MEYQNLFSLLDHAKNKSGCRGVISYALNELDHFQSIPYAELVEICWKGALAIQQGHCFKNGSVVLIHFNDHVNNIIWFWSVLLAGCIPTLSPPLPNDPDQRSKHLEHLVQLLEDPLCLTRRAALEDFAECPSLSLLAVDDLNLQASPGVVLSLPTAQPNDLAALMLTSGSTGNAKAVCLTHGQILASLAGKDSITELGLGVSLLNWIGMDHVAALVETHLLAMYRGLDQVHVQATDIVANPLVLLNLITKHNVARTVAPNFLLASLQRAITRANRAALADIDLSSLTQFVSGGEANPVELCVQLNQTLHTLGAPLGVIQPAFGMTETCAGCTYNTACPKEDLVIDMRFASLGQSVGEFEFRVVQGKEEDDIANEKLSGRRGTLQIRGPQVFSTYYRNPTATAESFTADGWFDTGDEALIDGSGNLHLVGRIKDQIRINGISMEASDVESHLNKLCINGATNDYFACFGYRPTAESERLAVLYLPTFPVDDGHQRNITNLAIAEGVVNCCSVSPFVLPLDAAAMQKSTLGKLSRGKLRRQLEQGVFQDYISRNEAATETRNNLQSNTPATDIESRLLAVVRETLTNLLGVAESAVQLQTPWYRLGTSSIHLIRLKRDIEVAMSVPEVPLLWLMNSPTIRDLAVHFQPIRRNCRDSACAMMSYIQNADTRYDPIVRLHSKSPLWFFHPGVGEVLVFINLARLVTDRSVYALRARGFNEGETFFADINEAVDTYYAAIKSTQPHGPYALAGYSYGAMLAFETAKRLNDDGPGQDVQFLASFNLPPHIKFRMQQLDWTACTLHLASFLGLLPEPELEDAPASADRRELLRAVFKAAPRDRLAELSLGREAFAQWSDLAHAMQSMAREYQPRGTVPSMDVFYCSPLAIVARNKQEWMENHIGHWKEFSNDVRFHEVDGEHYTMIDADHVEGFHKTFTEALTARGL